LPASKPIAILSADDALGQSLAFALAAEGFPSENFSDQDWHRAAQDNQRFLCFIIDEQALPMASKEIMQLACRSFCWRTGLAPSSTLRAPG
jgi:FixJ family two-component response regulator